MTAVGVEEGNEAETTTLTTAGPVFKIRLTADRSTIEADGQDLVFVTVELTDDKGNVQPNADDKLVITSYSIHYTKLYDGARITITSTEVHWSTSSIKFCMKIILE